MSADNGYIIRKHPKGGFCLVDYSMSVQMEDMYKTSDGYPLANGSEEQFATIGEAINVDQSDPWGNGYWSEYGIHLDDECKKIQQSLLSELHESVQKEYSFQDYGCTCGYTSTYSETLVLHQVDALREQLRQLGG